jgi:hypothetical protein
MADAGQRAGGRLKSLAPHGDRLSKPLERARVALSKG